MIWIFFENTLIAIRDGIQNDLEISLVLIVRLTKITNFST